MRRALLKRNEEHPGIANQRLVAVEQGLLLAGVTLRGLTAYQ